MKKRRKKKAKKKKKKKANYKQILKFQDECKYNVKDVNNAVP